MPRTVLASPYPAMRAGLRAMLQEQLTFRAIPFQLGHTTR